ncbi:unnamed protein product [Acanthoscelides obtectus]|uniref:PiggyBac transposable element-derived protein domain-containing protein n=1 Tax=Acanthoscelides obtectus TaxID=200917 RepID=A0A9P0KDX7_ACAOB|nr:unnamed protein product [Acanthoscelides obtectus]CAK1631770.1 PiggyBac transposable element-derived protein 4 [Acanthoscelides obtectus]
MTYVAVVWGYVSKTMKKRLQAQQNIALREAVDAPWYVPNKVLYDELRQVPVVIQMKERARKFFENNEGHRNVLIKDALDYDPRTIRQFVMDRREQIENWLVEASDEEQVGGHNGRNGPKQKWSKSPPTSSTRTRSHNIILHLPGVKSSAKSAKTALECFSLFFSDDIINLLVTCTNQYIEVVRGKFQRERDAKDTDVEEMKALLGLLIMSGVLRASHLNFIDLWATNGTGVEMFRLTMSYQRFLFLLRCLRFDDRTTRAERLQIDNLAAIREICNMLQAKFQEAYSPGENVTIDEQLIGFRGRFKGKVYMPNTPTDYKK